MASIEHDGLDEPLLQIQEGHSRGSPGETEATHEDGLSWSESVKQRENNYARMCMLINREGRLCKFTLPFFIAALTA